MKFEFEQQEDTAKEPVAELYEFGGGPELCLAINTNTSRKVWFYEHGVVNVQSTNWDDDPIKRFYPGDSITIKF
jgi:hypothetical protein